MSTNNKPDKAPTIYPKCDWKYCRKPGTLFPIIVLPMPKWSQHKKAKIEMEQDLNVCTDHAQAERIEWFLDDDNWTQLCNALAIRRLPIPDRRSVSIIFRVLEDRKVQQ